MRQLLFGRMRERVPIYIFIYLLYNHRTKSPLTKSNTKNITDYIERLHKNTTEQSKNK